MPGSTNEDTNQTSGTIHLPDDSEEVKNQQPPEKPNEHVPPVEVPGREETPEPVPEKSRTSYSNVFDLVINRPAFA